MAKGQKRSSREAKKPKQPKKAAVPASPFGVQLGENARGSRAQEKEIGREKKNYRRFLGAAAHLDDPALDAAV